MFIIRWALRKNLHWEGDLSLLNDSNRINRIVSLAKENYLMTPVTDDIFQENFHNLWLKIRNSTFSAEAEQIIDEYPFTFYGLMISKPYADLMLTSGFQEHVRDEEEIGFISDRMVRKVFQYYDLENFDNGRDGAIWKKILELSQATAITEFYEERFSPMIAPALSGNTKNFRNSKDTLGNLSPITLHEVPGVWNLNLIRSGSDAYLQRSYEAEREFMLKGSVCN